MRWLVMGSVIACVSGCASNDPPLPHLASQPCAKVAESRMNDARVNGDDAAAQNAVFRFSYADCVKWEAKGYEPPIP